MKILGYEITKIKTNRVTRTITCYHCGKEFQTGIDNIRAYNYCSSC